LLQSNKTCSATDLKHFTEDAFGKMARSSGVAHSGARKEVRVKDEFVPILVMLLYILNA